MVPEPGPPAFKAVRRILAALPTKKPQPLNPMNYRSSLSVAGPGRGQGTREAGGEGLRAGCAKARVKFKASLGRTGKGGSLLTATAAAAASLGLLEERHPCRRDWGCPCCHTTCSLGRRRPLAPIKDHPWAPPKPERLRGEGEGQPSSRALLCGWS